MITIPLQNGHSWHADVEALYIPVQSLENMTSEEIGQYILALVPSIHQMTAYLCRGGLPHGMTLEQFNELYQHEQSKLTQRDTPQQNKKVPSLQDDIRKELQRHYAKFFMYIGRRDGFHCQQCHTTTNLQIDHIRPVAKGGDNTIENLQLLCQGCNNKKGKTFP